MAGSSRGPLGSGAEFDRIRTLLGRAGPLPSHVRLGPGDDAAVVEGGPIVVSSDLAIEGVHFRRDWLSPDEIAFRAVSAALSDLAAMAASPLGLLVSLALPRDEPDATVESLGAGIAEACAASGAPLLGGDLSASPGPLILDVTVLGVAPAPVRRDGGRAGDEVWVTGWLGASAAAVRAWERGQEPPDALRRAFARPQARVQEALWLAGHAPLHAMIDLSDGLLGDAGHLAAASRLAVTLDLWRIPVHPAVAGLDPAAGLELALAGGEDYELCFLCPPDALDSSADAFRDRFGLTLTRVGSVAEGSGLHVRPAPGDPPRAPAGHGFDHFANGRGT